MIDHLKKKYYEVKAENTDLRIQLNLIETGLASGNSPVNTQPTVPTPTAVRKTASDSESLLDGAKTLAKRVKSSVQTVIPAGTSDRDLDEGIGAKHVFSSALRSQQHRLVHNPQEISFK